MNATTQPDGGNQIETALDFDVNNYPEEVSTEQAAEATIERGDRRVVYLYDLREEEDETTLLVHSRYFDDDELVSQTSTGFSGASPETHPVENGRVMHTSEGQELNEFIEDNAFADPEVSITDEWESFTN